MSKSIKKKFELPKLIKKPVVPTDPDLTDTENHSGDTLPKEKTIIQE